MLLTLPVELIAHILKFCETSHLRSVRLACNRLAQVAEPCLFREVVLLPAAGLEGLIEFYDTIICSSRQFAPNIQRLVYDARWEVRNARQSEELWAIPDGVAVLVAILRKLPMLHELVVDTSDDRFGIGD